MRYGAVILGAFALAACSPDAERNVKSDQVEDVEMVQSPAARPDHVEDRFALLALSCVHKEYPNKISHVMASDSDAKPPRELTPAFYGCFDWHSSVHGHWLLARILKTDPASPMKDAIVSALNRSLTPDNIDGELTYYLQEGRAAFERPYGLAWFLQLVAELEEADDVRFHAWRNALRPLETAVVEKTRSWLDKLAYPVRIGTHNQTAFAFGLMLDYARTVDDAEFAAQIEARSRLFYENDVACPLSYEPSGEDFLSPCLMEADLMRRIMPQEEFANWLSRFLPDIPEDASGDWLEPGVVLDATDGKLVHLDGVNLSRAWAMEGVASALPEDDPRRAALLASAALHAERGIAAVSDEHYSGSHWLGSFAAYLTTKRGIPEASR